MKEMVFCAIFSCRGAEMQREAQMLGDIGRLTAVEIEKGGDVQS
jgi:hypothetical protein